MIIPSILIVPGKYNNNKLISQIPVNESADFTVSRLTTATRVNSNGLINLVTNNVPRIDYLNQSCPALLVEAAATNQIRNNSMVGAVTGSSSTLPTNWGSLFFGGLTRQIVATGVINGIQYIDIRLSGTATEAGGSIFFDTITASSGQVWTSSFWFDIISQPNPANGFRFQAQNRLATVFVSDQFATLTPAGFIRYQNTTTVPSGVDNIRPCLNVQLTVNQFYDFTIRIGYPQMEQSSFATSVIPTTTGTGSRDADVISVSSISSLIGQNEGTVYIEYNMQTLGVEGYAIRLVAASFENSVHIRRSTANLVTLELRALGSNVFSQTLAATGFVKAAIAYKSGDIAAFVNGTPAGSTSTSAFTFGASFTSVNLGTFGTAAFLNDRIRAAALYTTRLSNNELQLLTKL